MDSWADEEFSPKPVHGREQRNESVSQEEGSSFEVKKEILQGLRIGLARREPFMDSRGQVPQRDAAHGKPKIRSIRPCGGRINVPSHTPQRMDDSFRVGRFGGRRHPVAALRLPPATSEQAFSLRPQPPFLSRTLCNI